jgi:hypothetical protein
MFKERWILGDWWKLRERQILNRERLLDLYNKLTNLIVILILSDNQISWYDRASIATAGAIVALLDLSSLANPSESVALDFRERQAMTAPQASDVVLRRKNFENYGF